MQHVELQDEWLGAAKVTTNDFVAESSCMKFGGFKDKENWKYKGKGKENEERSYEKKTQIKF